MGKSAKLLAQNWLGRVSSDTQTIAADIETFSHFSSNIPTNNSSQVYLRLLESKGYSDYTLFSKSFSQTPCSLTTS